MQSDVFGDNQLECPTFSPFEKILTHDVPFLLNDTTTYQEASFYHCHVKWPKIKETKNIKIATNMCGTIKDDVCRD